MYGGYFTRVSEDMWNVSLDKVENEAYDNIKMVHKGDGITAPRVIYRWFIDVSGLGLAEQARLLMHPSPPKKEEEEEEEELAEYVEMYMHVDQARHNCLAGHV